GSRFNRIEKAIIEAIHQHQPISPILLFRVISDRLPIYGMGDLEFWRILAEMEERGAIQLDRNGGKSTFPDFHTPALDSFKEWTIRILEASVQSGGACNIPSSISRIQYLGGAQWEGDCPWVWDQAAGRLIKI